MVEATYMSFVPKTKRDKLRQTLTAEDTGQLRWRERRLFSGSEFYFTGPSDLVRRTHNYITQWLVGA